MGGGFGGLYAALELGGRPVQVTLLDRRNYHLFQPLLYQVATAALSPADIAQPIRHILNRCANIEVRLGEVTEIDTLHRRLYLTDGEIPYDRLIVATGASHAYFGHDDWARHAPGLKTIEDAQDIRNRILLAYEQAEVEPHESKKKVLTTFVIVGGGPTGIELAGALAEIATHTLKGEFRKLDPSKTRILLIEAAPRILPGFDPDLSEAARRQLEGMRVEIHVNTAVTRIGPGFVEAGKLRIEAATILWAAGVVASPLAKTLGAPLDKAGRVRVQADLSVPGRPDIQVIGDAATLQDVEGKPVTGMAPAAIQMGRHAAHNILRGLRGEAPLPFKYRDKGIMAAIGRNAAVAQIGRIKLKGLPAWLAWLFVHLISLIGFRNRMLVLLQWAWSYLTFHRGVRLIMRTKGSKPL